MYISMRLIPSFLLNRSFFSFFFRVNNLRSLITAAGEGQGGGSAAAVASSPSVFSASFDDLASSQNIMSRQRLNGLLEGLADYGDPTTQVRDSGV